MIALWLAASAHATWSVVATDAATSQVGGAGTSCVGTFNVGIIFAAAPGIGAVHAQAAVSTRGRDRAAEILAKGGTPDDAITEISSEAFDTSAAARQYGVVDVFGNAAAFTGGDNGDWAGDLQGTDGTYTFSAQGNILTNAEVVTRTHAAFSNVGGCDLAERLIVSLAAGSVPSEGDSRCTPELPSDSAFIRVLDASGEVYLDLSVVDTAPDDPLVLLRAAFDDWRVDNPCDTPPTGSTGDTGAPTTTPGTGPGPNPTEPGNPTDDTGSPAPVSEDGGCGCGHTGTGAPWIGAVLLLSIFRRSRGR